MNPSLACCIPVPCCATGPRCSASPSVPAFRLAGATDWIAAAGFGALVAIVFRTGYFVVVEVARALAAASAP